MKKSVKFTLFSALIFIAMLLMLTAPVTAVPVPAPALQDGGRDEEALGVGVDSTTSRIIAYLSINLVQGQEWQLGEFVTLTIDDPDNGVGVDYTNSILAGSSGLVTFTPPWDLEPGMLLVMTDGTTTRTHTIIDLRITYVSEALDEFGGSTNVITPTVAVTARTDDVAVSKTTAVNPAGSWLANFKNQVDINPRSSFIVAQFDAQNNHTQVNWAINPIPIHDDILHPVAIPTVPWQHSANTFSATHDADFEPRFTACGQTYGNASVWYKFEPSTDGEVSIDTFGSNYNTMLGVWAGYPGSSGASIKCNDNAAGGLQSSVTFDYIDGVHYYIGAAQKGFPEMGGQLKIHITTFADVAGNHPLWRYVEGFYKKGITTGCATNPMRYCPDQVVTRAQMAVFMLRAVHADDAVPFVPINVEPDTFADAPASAWMEPWIEQFYLAGYTTGCAASPLRFCPEKGITRGEMAVFLLRAKFGSGFSPVNIEPDIFIDPPANAWMEPWLEQFYTLGYTTGCDGTIPGVDLKYCPERGAGRAEMATFIDRVFGFPPLP